MRNARTGIPVKTRGPITKRVLCFKGEEIVHWFIVRKSASKEQAVTLAQKMMKNQIFFHALNKPFDHFDNSSALFSFEFDVSNGCMLNQEVVIPKPEISPNPLLLSIGLLKTARLIFRDFACSNGKDLCFSAIPVERYQELALFSAELVHVQLSDIKDNIIKPFFLNIRNALCYHVSIAASLGLFHSPLDRTFWSKIGYSIGTATFTQSEIDHCILRCNIFLYY